MSAPHVTWRNGYGRKRIREQCGVSSRADVTNLCNVLLGDGIKEAFCVGD